MAGIEQLPARQRQALLLRELAGLSYTQLAAEMMQANAEAGVTSIQEPVTSLRIADTASPT